MATPNRRANACRGLTCETPGPAEIEHFRQDREIGLGLGRQFGEHVVVKIDPAGATLVGGLQFRVFGNRQADQIGRYRELFGVGIVTVLTTFREPMAGVNSVRTGAVNGPMSCAPKIGRVAGE